ncbi:caspase-8-like isoform X1 [Scyliorhinus canicula]|uniref:caspase-8-like isoform X1 n=1 Tax=Scyliorhinus canicula TaxID=7830 RepID=UPI0018F79F99|nr:caspase-8-like isoform X1 [Scyliorhinus canicula]
MDGSIFQFQVRLHEISENLGFDELKAMKFFCQDLLNSNQLNRADSGLKLFTALQEKGLLDTSDTFILAELLYRTKLFKLLRRLKYDKQEVCGQLKDPHKARISSYRQLLFEVSEDITTKDLETVKYFLHKELSKSKLENITTMLDVFIEMEKEGLLEENNMELLKKICSELGEHLVKKFDNYTSSVSARYATGGKDVKEQDSNAFHSQSVEMNSEQQSLDKYKMESNPRGYCVIINNSKFKTMTDRRGTNVDAERLHSIFSWLGFEVSLCKDLSASEMLDTMKDYQQMDHTLRDCFVCCILTHGEKGVMCGTDGQQVAISEITSFFSGTQCPTLLEKPKLFFIQACQGKKKQDCVEIEPRTFELKSRSIGSMSSSVGTETSNSPLEEDAVSTSATIPDEADFLLGMATVEGYVSYRHIQEGAWYIQSLCDNLEKYCPSEDLLSILTIVNRDVSGKKDKQDKTQMPQPRYTLRKKLSFPVTQNFTDFTNSLLCANSGTGNNMAPGGSWIPKY